MMTLVVVTRLHNAAAAAGGMRRGPRTTPGPTPAPAVSPVDGSPTTRCTAPPSPASPSTPRPRSPSPPTPFALLGRVEVRRRPATAEAALRLVAPLAKLTTGQLAVASASEYLEASAAPATSRTPASRGCSATPRCCRSGRAPPTCSSVDVLRALGRHRRPSTCCSAPRWRWTRRRPAAGRRRGARHRGPPPRRRRRGAAADPRAPRRRGRARGLALRLGHTLAAALLLEHAAWAAERGDDRPAVIAFAVDAALPGPGRHLRGGPPLLRRTDLSAPRGQVVAVQAADRGQRDALGADRGALAGVGAAAEPGLVHVRDHVAAPGVSRSGWPCGSRPRWVTLAAVNSIAEPFGQAATQAPQPMQAAASNAGVGVLLRHRDGVRVGRRAGRRGDEAAGLDDPVERGAVDDQVLDDREGARRATARRRSSSPSSKCRMCSWQVVVPLRAVRDAVDHHAAAPQMPSRQSWSNAIGSSPSRISCSLSDVEHLQEGHVRGDVRRPRRSTIAPGGRRPACRQTRR